METARVLAGVRTLASAHTGGRHGCEPEARPGARIRREPAPPTSDSRMGQRPSPLLLANRALWGPALQVPCGNAASVCGDHARAAAVYALVTANSCQSPGTPLS